MSDYTETDFRLLFEMRIALDDDRKLPLPMLRVLAARGWVHVPPVEQWVSIDDEMEPEDRFRYDVAPVRLTRPGRNELEVFRRTYADAHIERIRAEDTPEELDEDDE